MAYTKTIWKDFPSEDTPITSANLQKIEDALAGMLDYFYPVGTIYETTSTNLDTTTKMGNHFGGTWEVFGAGRVLVAKSTDAEFSGIEATGGAKTHTLTVAQMPSHGHDYRRGSLYAAEWVSGNSYYGQNSSTQGGSNIYQTASSGGGRPHNNLQPYIVVYRYRRTA